MHRMMIWTLCCAALLGCGKPEVVPLSDYCTVARPPVLADLCPVGTLPEWHEGKPSCSKLTRRDGETIAAEILKFNRCMAGPS